MPIPTLRLVACIGLWGLPALAGVAAATGLVDPAVAGPLGLGGGLALATACVLTSPS